MNRFLAGLIALQAVWLATAAAAVCPPLAGLETGGPTGQAASAILGRVKAPPPASPPRPMPQGRLEEAVVTLSRSGCYGDCPAYRVELRGEGTARFKGRAWVLAPGEHSQPLDPEAFACLFQHLREADFWSLPDAYVANASDGPTFVLTVTVGGQTKSVKDYMGRLTGMPVSVAQLEAEVDRLGAAPWVRGNDQTLALLEAEGLDFRSEEGGSLLARAAERESDSVALVLLARGAPPWGRLADWYPDDAPGETAPEIAARRGDAALLKALIDAGGAGPGAPAGIKDRILLAAADSSTIAVFRLAMSLKPDVNAANDEGRTALMAVIEPQSLNGAADGDAAEEVRMLIAAGADVKARTSTGLTALHNAQDAEVVRLLLAAGADIDARDEMGRTPLLAVYFEDAALALLQAGADPRAVDTAGEGLMRKAEAFRWKKVRAYLKSRGIRASSGPARS